jgi:hypothetical protein
VLSRRVIIKQEGVSHVRYDTMDRWEGGGREWKKRTRIKKECDAERTAGE